MLSWNNLCSQCAFILCPVTLSTIYTYSHEGSFYASILFVGVALIAISLLMSMKNAYELGRPRKTELPVVDKMDVSNTDVEEKKVDTPNTDVEEKKVETPNTDVEDKKEQSNIEMNEVNKTSVPSADTKEEGVQNDSHPSA